MDENVLDKYLESYGTNRNKVSTMTGVSYITFQRSTKKRVADISLRVIIAISQVLHKTPGEVLDDLLKTEATGHAE